MDHAHSSTLHGRMRAHRIDLGRALAVMVTLGLMVVMSIVLALTAVVSAGTAFTVDRSIALHAQHTLLIHLGSSPTCLFIPNPPQHDCIWPGSERRVFSVDYLTPDGVRSLVWFQLP